MVQTSSSCPEEYDVFLGTEELGHIYIRHGQLRTRYEDCTGVIVHTSLIEGDGQLSERERLSKLTKAVELLLKYHQEE